jgi:pimeloyl-ACP methyl ester carboxylesterase
VPEVRAVEVEGARIRVMLEGEPDGRPPLLLLHGGLGTAEDFADLRPLLAPRRLISIESRGQGGSTMGAARLSYARMAADVEAVAAALGVGACDILGFSDGGIVGYRLAAGAPGLRVRRLATIGAAWRLLPDDPVQGYLGRMTVARWREAMPAAAAGYGRDNPAPDPDALVAAIRALWLDADGYPGEAVRGISCPLLLLRGDRDPFFSRADALGLAERVAGARVVEIPFAGHGVQEEAPALVAALLTRFLDAPDA